MLSIINKSTMSDYVSQTLKKKKTIINFCSIYIVNYKLKFILVLRKIT